jgi:homocysteine S-methyltransferase
VRAAVEAALRARDRAAGARAIVVAGSLSHMAPVADSGEAAPADTELLAAFREVAAALAASGCDLILLEMMYHPQRMPLAIRAALETGLPVWLGLSARLGEDGRLLSYTEAETVPFADIVALMPQGGIDVTGVMHSSASATDPALEAVRRGFSGPLMAYPESGYFEMPHWRFVDVMSPEAFVGHCRRWSQAGVQVLGGCCGLGVEHIQALAQAGLD